MVSNPFRRFLSLRFWDDRDESTVRSIFVLLATLLSLHTINVDSVRKVNVAGVILLMRAPKSLSITSTTEEQSCTRDDRERLQAAGVEAGVVVRFTEGV